MIISLTKNQEEQMKNIFPNGYNINDIPALWRENEIIDEDENEDDYSPEYPLGGTLERYDIERENI